MLGVRRKFRTSVFNKVVRLRESVDVENVYIAPDFSHLVIYLSELIQIDVNLTLKTHSFYRTTRMHAIVQTMPWQDAAKHIIKVFHHPVARPF